MKDVKVNCETCVKSKAPETVSYFTYESMLAQNERVIRRLWVTVIVMIAVLIGTNLAWIIYEHQFEDIVVDQQIETAEGDAFVAGVGDVNYGEDKADSDGQTP